MGKKYSNAPEAQEHHPGPKIRGFFVPECGAKSDVCAHCMEGGIQLDTRQFDAAMKEYSYYTSKSLVDAVNGKARDLAFMAARHTAAASRSDIADVIENPRLISWYCNKLYGSGGWDRDDFTAAAKKLRKRLSSAKYHKSGFVKAAHKFPQTEASKELPRSVEKHKGSAATATIATASRMLAEMQASWETAGLFDVRSAESSKSSREKILLAALQQSIVAVTADMRKYIERKQAELCRKHSA